ncbi:hypothetical protein KSP40_PGU012769 [Platanthera guangdongensis]|uniref:Uncharacterized protein n=1 Tax=Platanthera guangdongensis TaxID=2320717 RepID=A0ABR2MWL9_9ASPA
MSRINIPGMEFQSGRGGSEMPMGSMFPAAQHLGLGIVDSNLGMLGTINAYNRSGGGRELMNSDHGPTMDRRRQQQQQQGSESGGRDRHSNSQ